MGYELFTAWYVTRIKQYFITDYDLTPHIHLRHLQPQSNEHKKISLYVPKSVKELFIGAFARFFFFYFITLLVQ